MGKLGRVDICTEVSMMSSHLVLPREGHLMELFRVFEYLKKHHNDEMPFDSTLPNVQRESFLALIGLGTSTGR